MSIFVTSFDRVLELKWKYTARFIAWYDQRNLTVDLNIRTYERIIQKSSIATPEQEELYGQALIIYEAKRWSAGRFHNSYLELLHLGPPYEYWEVYKEGVEKFLENGWPLDCLTEVTVARIKSAAGAEKLREDLIRLIRVENIILKEKKRGGTYYRLAIPQEEPHREYILQELLKF